VTATLIVILMLCVIAAGLVFASPLRRPIDTWWERRPRAWPGAWLRAPVDRLLDAVGARVAGLGRRRPERGASRQLPPMPGGDAFFAEDPN
jgi:uncharacterized iron-regulated membrane protein